MSDIDGDGQITNADLNSLIGLLRTGGASITVPRKPTSMILLVFAMPGLACIVAARLSRKREPFMIPTNH